MRIHPARRLVAAATSLTLLVAPAAGCRSASRTEAETTTTTEYDEGTLPPPEQLSELTGTSTPVEDPAQPSFTREQLEQLVAPIALYPDALLMEILMAATYPAEVAEAAEWVKAHPNLVGKELDDAIAGENWDVSVKAVTHAPKALELMAADPQWTRDLGDAFLAQQNDVLNAVQVMRSRACDLGNLKTTEQQQVIIEDAPQQPAQPAPATYVVPPPPRVVRIVPVQQDVFYVPTYNPRVIYGPPPPTIYYPRAYMYPAMSVGIAPIISFGVGLTIGALLWGDADWYYGRVYRHHHHYDHRHDYYRWGSPVRGDWWSHDPYHRRGITYPTRYVQRVVVRDDRWRDGDWRQRYERGSREYEGRLTRSGGWDRALRPDRERERREQFRRDGGDRARDMDRQRDDRDRDRFGTREREEDRRPGDRRERGDRGPGDADRRRDGRGPEGGDRDRMRDDRRPGGADDGMREDRGPGGAVDRDRGPAKDKDRGDRGRGGPGSRDDRAPGGPAGKDRGPGGTAKDQSREDRPGRPQDKLRDDRGPGGPSDKDRGPGGAAKDKGPGDRGPDRMDRGPGGADKGKGVGQGRPSRGDRSGGPPRSPGVSGREPRDKQDRGPAARPDSRGKPDRGPAVRPDSRGGGPSRSPGEGSARTGGGDRSRGPSGGSMRPDHRGGGSSGGDRRGGPSVQQGSRGPSDRGGSSRGGPPQRGGGGGKGQQGDRDKGGGKN